MSLNTTPSADRVHIGIFGKRNAGKSSLINAITGQDLAIVSDVLGTTTDPVLKAMELLPLGPVVLIDTPGLDDEGELGKLRIQKAYQILNKTDIAVLVVDASVGMTAEDSAILERIQAKKIPYVVVKNKSDLCAAESAAECPDGATAERPDGAAAECPDGAAAECPDRAASGFAPVAPERSIAVSTVTGQNIHELKELLARLAPKDDPSHRIVGDLLAPNDFVILVTPIDESAPKGRLILPQQQTIRDILEAKAVSIVVQPEELSQTLVSLGNKPKLVITDSQAFRCVSADVPADIPLTSFSILLARYKGSLATTVRGARALENLKDGNKILISEGCTHHRQCEDIGTVKLPRWIREYTGKNVEFVFTSGTEFPVDLYPYALIVHCGGCTLNEREMKYRLKCAEDQNIPMTNYGICIAYINGILERSVNMFEV